MFKKEKKGWIKIVEAFISILLFMAVVLLIVSQKSSKTNVFEERIHNDQIFLLRYIQLNDTLRQEILNTDGSVNWSSFEEIIPKTYNAITLQKPNYLICEAKICQEDEVCLIDKEKSNIYSESVLITSNSTSFKPKILKVFCWPR
jgi:hypothetical protein